MANPVSDGCRVYWSSSVVTTEHYLHLFSQWNVVGASSGFMGNCFTLLTPSGLDRFCFSGLFSSSKSLRAEMLVSSQSRWPYPDSGRGGRGIENWNMIPGRLSVHSAQDLAGIQSWSQRHGYHSPHSCWIICTRSLYPSWAFIYLSRAYVSNFPA